MIQTELSADARAVADLLLACPVGGSILYSSMSKAIGRDILDCRHILGSARKCALREGGAVFVVERGEGLTRISAERATETVGSTARRHIRRTASRARKTLMSATAGANDLSADAMRRMAAEVSVLSLMEHLSRDKVVAPKEDSPTRPTPVAVTARTLLSHFGAQQEEAPAAPPT